MKKRFFIAALLTLTSLALLLILNNLIEYSSFNSADLSIESLNNENKDSEKEIKLEYAEPIVQKPSDNLYVEILPSFELLSGVLAQTTWDKVRGPVNGVGNDYYKSLKEFFSQYKEHEAIKIAQELTDLGFTYDAPPAFILTLGDLPTLNTDNEYNDYLIGRSGGKDILERFRLALIDLSEESNFLQFFEDNRDVLSVCMDSAIKNVDLMEVINWNTNFYGESNDEFHLVFAPSMCFGGGYGATVEKSDGSKNIYQIIREKGGTVTPYFSSGVDIGTLSLHEWGHAYVNPAIQLYSDDFSKYTLDEFFEPVKQEMSNMAYPETIYFLNEQVLRSCTIVAYEELYGKSIANRYIEYYESIGFYLTQFTIETLNQYTANREKYPNFKDFIPYLFEQYKLNKDSLLKLAN